MAPNPNREHQLLRVVAARARTAEARDRLKQAELAEHRTALEAIAEGVPLSRVADTLGVSRMTLYRWAETTKEAPARVPAAGGMTAQEVDHEQQAAD